MATNKRRFTEAMIDRLRPPNAGRIELGDEVVPGLVLRVTPSGVKSFSLIYKVPGEGGVSASGRPLAGRQHRITLGQYPRLKLTKAREEARKKLEVVTEGRDPRPEMRKQNLIRHTNTMEKVSERFIEQDAKRTVESWRKIERTLELHVLPTMGDRPIRDVRRADVHELLDKLVANGKVGTAREVRKHLSRLFNWAVDREIVTDNPMHGMQRKDLVADEETGRALTDAELRAIWSATDTLGYPAGPYYRLTLLTGCRRGEWAGAKRSEISADDRLFEIPAARYKSRRDHVVPLADPAWAIFETLPTFEGNDFYMFSTRAGRRPISGFSHYKSQLDDKALEALRKADPKAVLAPWDVHDMRRTAETRLATLGIGQETRDAVLGHAKPGLQKTYNRHDYLQEKREALAAYGEHIMKVVS